MWRKAATPVRTWAAVSLLCALTAQSWAQSNVTDRAAVRFLEQSSFGPTASTVAHLKQVGFNAFLDEQFAAEATPWPDPVADATGKTSWAPTQQQFFVNAVQGEDQLRQRVAWALLQIWVVSGVKLDRPEYEVPYLRLLAADAFTDYRQIMRDVTLSPAMGRYLDMVNNNKPSASRNADENYARELLQLFTLGLETLYLDGTVQRDAHGVPVPTYTQNDIENLALVLTGWTYAPAAGAASKWTNPANWSAPLVAVEAHHDTTAKTLFGSVSFAANQSAERDLDVALDAILEHPNLAPFVSRQLIQRLVTSDPEPAYVSRVATVFRATDGDMKQVVRAILLDPDARQGDNTDSPPGFGTLREPVLFIANTLRALGATVASTNALPGFANNMGQKVFFPPSVFNYDAPGYVIAGTSINAPTFQLLTPSTAIARANFVNSLIYGNIGGVSVPLDSYIAATPADVLAPLDRMLLQSRMSDEMNRLIQSAMVMQPGGKAQAQTALYLVLSSQQYQVQR